MVFESLIQTTMPDTMVPVPRVATKGSTPKRTTMNPLAPPTTAEASMAATIAHPIGQWWWTLSTATTMADNVRTEATERS